MRTRIILATLALMTCFVLPTVLAHQTKDRHDCHQDPGKGGKFHCVRGPLTGQSFASRKDMLKALNAQVGTAAPQKTSEPAQGKKKVARKSR
jgi:hypothetical protein